MDKSTDYFTKIITLIIFVEATCLRHNFRCLFGPPEITRNTSLYPILEMFSFIVHIFFQYLPVILQSKRKVGVSPLNTELGPSLMEFLGIGIVIVIGLWNFLRLGSNVTMGLNVALLPRTFRTISTSMG